MLVGNVFLTNLTVLGGMVRTGCLIKTEDIKTVATKESESESKMLRETFALAITQETNVNDILEKHSFWKSIRITGWVDRFIFNCKTTKLKRKKGPLKSNELQDGIDAWIRRDQTRYKNFKSFENDRLYLNLQPDDNGILRCRGRIQGEYPVYLSPDSLLSGKIVMHARLKTLHGGVGLTMSAVRENFWIPRLLLRLQEISRDSLC